MLNEGRHRLPELRSCSTKATFDVLNEGRVLQFPQVAGGRESNNRLIRARRRARRADMEKNIAAGSAVRLSAAQAAMAKNTAAGSAARLGGQGEEEEHRG